MAFHNDAMSEENTHNLPHSKSFEERVFMRFDSVDARLDRVEQQLDSMDGRIFALEAENERRALETKPIWERALAEISRLSRDLNDFRRDTNEALHNLSRKIGVLSHDMIKLRADQLRVETRMDDLESGTRR